MKRLAPGIVCVVCAATITACAGTPNAPSARPSAPPVSEKAEPTWVTGPECHELADRMLATAATDGGPASVDRNNTGMAMAWGGAAQICVSYATRSEYACAKTARDADHIMRCLAPAFDRANGRLVDGKVVPATAEQCSEMADHFMRMVPDYHPEDRESLLRDCSQRVTRNLYECIMAAEDLRAIEACMPEGKFGS